MQNRFNRNIFQGAEFKASQPKLGQASSGSGLRRCGPAAPLHWGAAAGGSAAAGAAATGSGRPSGCASVADISKVLGAYKLRKLRKYIFTQNLRTPLYVRKICVKSA